jgi:hypothetical protein
MHKRIEVAGSALFVPDKQIAHCYVFVKNRVQEWIRSKITAEVNAAIAFKDSFKLVEQGLEKGLHNKQIRILAFLSVVRNAKKVRRVGNNAVDRIVGDLFNQIQTVALRYCIYKIFH